MIKRFIIKGVSKKFKGLQRVKSYKPVEKKFTEQAASLRQEAAEKIARRAESRSLESGMKKIRSISMKLFKDTKFYTKKPGTNFKVKTTQGKSTLKRIDKAKTQAFKTARAKGVRTLQKSSDKLGVGIRRFGNQKTKTIQRLSDDEARELGFPPREIFKSSKKTPMTNIDKTIDQYSRLEKFNPKTGKYQTFRTYNIKTKTGRVGRELTYLENKLRKK
jgi:hypothetical protein